MTAVITTYFMLAPEGFSLPKSISYTIGSANALLTLVLFLVYKKKRVPFLP